MWQHPGRRRGLVRCYPSKADKSPNPGITKRHLVPHLSPTPWKASALDIKQLCPSPSRLSLPVCKIQAPTTDSDAREQTGPPTRPLSLFFRLTLDVPQLWTECQMVEGRSYSCRGSREAQRNDAGFLSVTHTVPDTMLCHLTRIQIHAVPDTILAPAQDNSRHLLI